jgi:hypothetical protein
MYLLFCRLFLQAVYDQTQGSGVMFFLHLRINSNSNRKVYEHCMMGWKRFQRDCSEDKVVYVHR